jgi:hypothetical protein
MATLIAILPFLTNQPLDWPALARLMIVVFACVLVYQGRLWARWLILLFAGLAAGVLVLQGFRPGLAWVWRLAFILIGGRLLWALGFLFLSPAAKAYYASVAPASGHDSHGV